MRRAAIGDARSAQRPGKRHTFRACEHASRNARMRQAHGGVDAGPGSLFALCHGVVCDRRRNRAAVDRHLKRILVGFIRKPRIHAVRVKLGLGINAVSHADECGLHRQMRKGKRTRRGLPHLGRTEAHRSDRRCRRGGNQADGRDGLGIRFPLPGGNLIGEGRIAKRDRPLRIIDDYRRFRGSAHLSRMAAEVKLHRLTLRRGDDQATRRMDVAGKHVTAALRNGHASGIPLGGDIGSGVLSCTRNDNRIRRGGTARRIGKRHRRGERRSERARERDIRTPADKALRFGYTVVRHAESFATALGHAAPDNAVRGPHSAGPFFKAASNGRSLRKAFHLKQD